MATWSSDNVILTKLGEQVLSKVQAGIGKLTVSRIVSGSGHVSPSQLYNQTQVTDIKQELIIDRYSTTNSSSSISTSLSNSGITEAYDLYQIGIYVTHPDFTDEVLYLIAQCDSPDHIPVPEDTPVTLSYELVMAHSGTDNVTINVTGAGNVSVDTFNQFADEVKSSLDKKASSENPVFTGEMHLTGDDSTTSVTIFTSENTVTIRNTDPNAENTTYTDLVITPDGIYKESVDNGVIIERTKINDGGNADTLKSHPASDFALKTDIPTTLPANGGNADTLNGRSTTGINSLIRYTAGNYDCNTTISTGVYRGTFTNYPSGLPDGQGILLVMNYHGANSEVSGTVGTDTTWLRQWFISPHGYSIYERLVVNTTVTAWTPINDGGNAHAVDGKHASDFVQNLTLWEGVSVKEQLLKTTQSGFVWIDRTCTDLPDGTNTWWYGIVIHTVGHYQLIITDISNVSTYVLSYNAGTTPPKFYGWRNLSDGGNAATVNGLTVQTAVPANAKFTDTTYGAASASATGLVSTGAQTFAGNKTFNGQVIPVGATDLNVAQARRIMASTTDLTAGSSSLTTGTIYLVYE